MEKVLITGAAGQLGSELTLALSEIYGVDAIIASDLHQNQSYKFDYCRYETLDVMDQNRLGKLLKDENIKQVYHLAAILSAVGEKKSFFAWKVNMESLLNLLEFSRILAMEIFFWPSSIAVFGTESPKQNTPQNCTMNPDSVYGISKQAGERWCEYYFKKHQVDVRSLRFPGLIGYKSLPGGGTTDYAVDIYHKAVAGENFECFLKANTYLPMMYMPDAIQAIIDLMHAPRDRINIRDSYNLAGMSISPQEIFESIREYYPNFEISYKPDFRQQIADSWPDSIDDSTAKKDWGWANKFNLRSMTRDMVRNLPDYIPQLNKNHEK